MNKPTTQLHEIPTDHPIWDRFFTVNPLVIIGTKEENGADDLAPKHMAFPMGWKNYFGFVCTPRHSTYGNARRENGFTVSYPKPTQVIITSLTAAPRCEDNSKPSLDTVDKVRGKVVDAPLIAASNIQLECELDRIIDDFGENSLIVGRVVRAYVDPKALRREDRDDHEVIFESPLLAYLSPGRYTVINKSQSFPFPKGFSK